MSNGNFIPDGEAQFRTWLENFAAKCEEYDGILDLNVTDIGIISNGTTAYTTSYVAQASAKEALVGLTSQRNKNRKDATAIVRAYAKKFKANPNVPQSVLGALGILASSTSGPVTTVTSLDVVGCDDGVNKLSWNRNSNAQGTNFIIEFSSNGTVWSFAGAVTRVTFEHRNQVPGQTLYYRVISTRAGVNSAPSAPVVVYPSSGSGELRVAA